MICIEQVCSRLAIELKTVRLAALKDTPSAFGSTYAKESQRSDQDWLNLTSAWNSDRSVCYLAMDLTAPCGIIAGKFDDLVPRQAWVLSMWVAPTHRRSCLGTRLVDAVQRWARDQGIRELRLMVTSNNHAAQAFYARCGFTRTGTTKPYENDPALFEYEMAKAI